MEWTEGLLWIEPETVCVPTNLTLDYALPDRVNVAAIDTFLTDRGAFLNLTRDYPFVDFNDSQVELSLCSGHQTLPYCSKA